MHHSSRLLPVVIASLVAACAGQVVEGTGAGSTGGADGSSGDAPTTDAPTTNAPTSADPDTGGASEPTSAGPGETGDATSADPTADPTTASTDPTTATTGDTATGGGDPVCGNGVPEPGEPCDDGNAEQADGCTTLCRAPLNCLELLMLAPGTPNESYDIDPESDGSVLHVYCDMMGGGWTQVYYDEFNDKNGWSAGEISECGELGKILGGFDQFGYDDSTQKQIGLQNVAHTQLRLIAELAILDSWDGEDMFAEVDGQEVAKKACTYWDPKTCGQTKNQCGGPDWADGNQTIAGDRDHAGDIAVLKFRADLSEDADNESWGLDTVYVFVK